MRKTSLIVKYLMIILASLGGAVLVLILLALYSRYVQYIPFLEMIYIRNGLRSLYEFMAITPWATWLLIAMGTFIALFMAMTLPTILRIKRVSKAVRQIAEGDLSVRVKPRGRDELSSLEADVNRMVKRIERAFQLQREAERSKDEFVINIAHDLRTPLTSVLGYLTLIDEKGGLSGESAQYAQIALAKANQLSALVNDLFDLLRMTPDAMKIELERFSAHQFLLQVQDEACPLLSAADMQIRLRDVPQDLFIEADGSLLSRVYDNLILNATHYAAQGRFIDLSARSEPGAVLLTLTTHANPIPEAELERVFDRLHRVESSRSTKTGGAGLGLAICKRIVALHGGTIRATRADRGTCFEIRLPATHPAPSF